MADICVLGLGYVGLPTASLLADSGFHVTGVDIDPKVVEALDDGRTCLKEEGLSRLIRSVVKSKRLVAAAVPCPAQVYIICVPTPTLADHRVDLHAVESATRSILPHLRRGNLVILESTSPVGTTRNLVGGILAESGLQPGVDFDLCYCPERVLPGNTIKELVHNCRVIGGITPHSAQVAHKLYQNFCRGTLTLTDDKTAELCKLMENTYRDVNIALSNVFANICESEGLNAWEAIRHANLHPRVNILNPGPGVGGHCIPVDPWFLIQQYPQHTSLLRTARLVNDSQGVHMLDRLTATGKLNAGDKLTILGAAYKADVDDPRESPAFTVAEAARARGMKVDIHDPLVTPGTYHGFNVSNDLNTALAHAAAAILITDHASYRALPADVFADTMTGRLIGDTRAALNHPALIDAGFMLFITGVGDFVESKPKPAIPHVVITDAANKTLSRV